MVRVIPASSECSVSMACILESEGAAWHLGSREVVMSTLGAEAIVPESYPTVAAALWQPERRLMLAVLEDAIDCYLANVGAQRGIRRARFVDAARWFQSNDTEWPFSFVCICDALGIDPAVIRRMLVRQVPRPAAPTRPPESIWDWKLSLPSFERMARALSAD
jgi:hypothetical protein